MKRNESLIQALKMTIKAQNKKIRWKTPKARLYPRTIENQYYSLLHEYFKEIVNHVEEAYRDSLDSVLRGDSLNIKLDNSTGGTFREISRDLLGWVDEFIPSISNAKEKPPVIMLGLNKIADNMEIFETKEMQKQIEKSLGVKFPYESPWWDDVKQGWADRNYALIKNNSSNYVANINDIVEKGVVNGWSVSQVKEQIKKANKSITESKAKLIARDQIGKLNGQVTQAQQEELGLEMYVFSTSGDERVRGNPGGIYPKANPSHYLMDGLYCRWDDSSVCSKDKGKTWESRPSKAVKLHPGQDIQCRCTALSVFDELFQELS